MKLKRAGSAPLPNLILVASALVAGCNGPPTEGGASQSAAAPSASAAPPVADRAALYAGARRAGLITTKGGPRKEAALFVSRGSRG